MMTRTIAFVFSLFTAMTMSLCALAQDGQGVTPRTIPLSGFGVIEVRPEFASVKIIVSSQAETVDKVLTVNKEAVEKLRAKIAPLSLPQSDVKVAEPQISQGYSSKKGVLSSMSEKAFNANTTLEVAVRDLPNSSRILGALFTLEDVQVHSLTWDVSDNSTPMDKARIAAITDARRRADLYVQAAGAKVGRILTIEETARQDITYENRDDRYATKTQSQPLTPPSTILFRAGVKTVWSIE